MKPGSKVLYLGAAAGTTVSHVSDIVGPTGCVYAVEFAHRPGRDLINMAKSRTNVIPIIEDARHPLKYRMLMGKTYVEQIICITSHSLLHLHPHHIRHADLISMCRDTMAFKHMIPIRTPYFYFVSPTRLSWSWFRSAYHTHLLSFLFGTQCSQHIFVLHYHGKLLFLRSSLSDPPSIIS